MREITTQTEIDAVQNTDEWVNVLSGNFEAWGSAHVVARGSAHVVARESAHVEARESAHVEAWGSAHVEARESAHVVARESAHVVARESAHVEARESAHVEAWGSAHVEARESAHVEAWGSAHVVARESAHVEARESAHVEAWESAHVVARESAHVVARESAHVEAWGSAHVEARESAHVVARESAHVVARESAHVVAWDFSSIVKLSEFVTLKKGSKAIVIEPNYPKEPAQWSRIKGVRVENERIYLYTVLRLNGRDYKTNSIDYLGRKEVMAPDWDANYTSECGSALHLADSPEGAKYFLKDRQNYILCEVSAALSDCRCYPGQPEYPMKLRARACKIERIIEKVENGRRSNYETMLVRI